MAPKATQVEGGKPKSDKKVATAIPTFLDKDGKITMVTTTKKNDKGDVKSTTKPIRLRPNDFPRSTEGKRAFCRYQVAMWTWKGENVSARGSDPIAKKERQVERAMKRLQDLQSEVAEAKKKAGIA